MAEQKITDEMWAEARKRYETEPGLGLGKIAQLLDCSKSLVARKAREGRWQKGIGIPAQVWNGALAREAKVTENAVHSPTQGVHVNASEPYTRPSHAVADTSAPSAPSSGRSSALYSLPELPENIEPDSMAAADFYRAAGKVIVRRQSEGHAAELAALRNDFVKEMRAAGKEGTAASARRHKELMLATEKRHKLETENLAAWLKNELGGLGVVLGYSEVRIVVVFAEDSPLTPRRVECGTGSEGARAAADIMERESRLRRAHAAGEVIDVEAS